MPDMKPWHTDYCNYPDCNCADVYEWVPVEED